MVNKLILAAMGLMLGCGSIIGYFLARWDLQSNILKPQSAIAATESKAKQISPPRQARATLEEKYHLCSKSSPQSVSLARFSDKALNDLVYNVCSEKS